MAKKSITLTDADWADVLKVPAADYLSAVKAKLFPRQTEIELTARRAYETAPIGEEAAAVWNALKRIRGLKYIEVINAAWALPSRKVEREVLEIYRPIQKARADAAERRERARRKRVLAQSKKHSKRMPKVIHKFQKDTRKSGATKELEKKLTDQIAWSKKQKAKPRKKADLAALHTQSLKRGEY